MRRGIVSLCVLLCAIPVISGCRLFGKGKTEGDLAGPATQTGTESAYQPEPYAYPAATPTDTYATTPTGPVGGGRTHTVAKGDTLYQLARTYYGDQAKWKSIYEANRSAIGSDPNKIRVGQRLVIP